MDKVMIDGVDVNKCGYYKDGDCLLSPVTCEEFIDCDFKEIKRLQAENEKLKQVANDSIIEQEKLIAKVNELQAENERLKETEKEISDFISDISTCGFKYDDRCPDNLDELQQCIEDLCNKFGNYKQALQEIRNKLDFNKQELEECLYNPIDDEIRKIINSVIGEEE